MSEARRSRQSTSTSNKGVSACISITSKKESKKEPIAILSSQSSSSDAVASAPPAVKAPAPAAFVEKDLDTSGTSNRGITSTKEAIDEEERIQPDSILSQSSINGSSNSTRKKAPAEVKHQGIRPCPVSSTCSMAAGMANQSSTNHTDGGNSNEREKKKKTAPVAFVEKDFLVKQEPEEEEGEARRVLLPETITSGETSTGSPAEQNTTKEQCNDDDSNINDGVANKKKDSLTADNDTNNKHKRRNQGSEMASIKSEELDNNGDACTLNITRRSKRKRKQCPSSTLIPTNGSDQRQKKKRNNNQQGGKPSVVNSNACRTSPRNKKHQEEEEEEEEEKDQKDNTTTTSSTIDNIDCSNDNNGTNCCQFCNNPYWKNKIYYKCGTVLSKYFPKSDNNPNPGWYRGTIRMHHCSSSNSGAGSEYDYEKEADGSSEEESDHQQIIYNEIHYEDGDMENIKQDDLKLQLMNGGRVKILHPKRSNSEYRNRVDNNMHPPTSYDNKCGREWLEKYQRLQKFKAENGQCRVPVIYDRDPSLGIWVGTQRKNYKKGTLAPDRVEKLEEIGFDWDPRATMEDQMWQGRYDGLKRFKAKNGHCRVPHHYSSDPSLANWVRCQRKRHKKGNLAEDRVKKLNKIGFEWDPGAKTMDLSSWQEKYNRLKKFKYDNGHCRVPCKYDPDPSLGNWVAKQREQHKQGTLAKEHAEKLNTIGFDWGPLFPTWDEMFGRLEQFKAENGHCRVPHHYGSDPSLANWVRWQRKRHKKGNLAEDRVKKLNKIGFEWDPGAKTMDLSSWQEKYNRLKKFKCDNGHCRVPCRYDPDPSLGNWVAKQREQHKQGTLAKEHTEKLNTIGFDWGPLFPTWDEMFGRLEQFKAENGHCRVPQGYTPDPSLGNWVKSQRRDYKKGKMAPDRLQKLNDIGFEWYARVCH